jgi:hypothetical protein
MRSDPVRKKFEVGVISKTIFKVGNSRKLIEYSGVFRNSIPKYSKGKCICLFLSAEGFDNSTETLLCPGTMWPFAWHTDGTDVYITYGRMPGNIVNMHAVPSAGLAGARRKRNGTKIQSDNIKSTDLEVFLN